MVNFKFRNRRDFYNDDVKEEYSVKKEESFEFILLKKGGGMDDEYFNPNNEIVRIIFSDINANGTIKEIANENLFEFIGPKKGKMPNYLLKINNELLYKE
jgi:hypothetical protein